MREPYGILLSSFWDGDTGQKLQAAGRDALILAAYLSANRFANMIGLYEISLTKILRALPVLKTLVAVRKAIGVLAETRYAFYDETTEYVWVREMARVRLQLDGTPLDTRDKRLLGATKLYESLPLNPFLGPFFDRYSVELHLTKRRGGGPLLDDGASQGASEGAYQGASEGASEGDTEGACLTPSPTTGTSNQVPVHQVPVSSRDQETGTSDQEKLTRASARDLPRPDESEPDENFSVIAALIHKELLPKGISDEDLPEAVKTACAQRHLAYDSDVVHRAIEIAKFRAHMDEPMLATPTGRRRR